MTFEQYCNEVEGISYYEMLLPDEYAIMEDRYKHYCIDNEVAGDFELD